MQNEVYRVLYCSRISGFKSEQDVGTDLMNILLCSRTANRDHDVTGVLVASQRAYSQVLEGPRAAVKNLISHIACDRRHLDFKVLGQQTSDVRLFQEWSMAAISTERGQEGEDFLFPNLGGQSDTTSVHAFCSSLRRYLLRTRTL